MKEVLRIFGVAVFGVLLSVAAVRASDDVGLITGGEKGTYYRFGLDMQKLVKTRRDAQTIYYSSTSDSVIRVLDTLEDIYCEPEKSRSAA